MRFLTFCFGCIRFCMQISVCGFQAGEQLLSLIVAILTASVAIGAGQIVANVVNTRAN